MKKTLMLVLVILLGALLFGCSANKEESVQKESKKETTIGKKDTPDLVFFFTGISYEESKVQLIALQKNKKFFSEFPGDIYVVSRATNEQHKKLKKELKLDFKLVSDPELKMIEKVKLANKNGYAILDKNGDVIYTEEVNTFGEEAEGIIYFALQEVDTKK